MTIDKDDAEIASNLLKSPIRSEDEREAIIKQYEESFSQWNGCKWAFSFESGRVALSALIHAVGLSTGDEVILPAYTCQVVPNAFRYAGINTVFADIELQTFGLDVRAMEQKITSRTKAIFIQHLYGLVCRDFEEILSIARDRGMLVIEDCAQAAGAEFRGQKLGNFGDAAFYSTERAKVFTTIRGGLATTNNERIADGIRAYYNRSKVPGTDVDEKLLKNILFDYYRLKHPQKGLMGTIARLLYGDDVVRPVTAEEERGQMPLGYGGRLPYVAAKVGLNQLLKIDKYIEARRSSAEKWNSWCKDRGYTPPLVIKDSMPVFPRFPVLVEPENKADLSWVVKELMVPAAGAFYTHVLEVQPVASMFPNTDEAVRRCINLPTLNSQGSIS